MGGYGMGEGLAEGTRSCELRKRPGFGLCSSDVAYVLCSGTYSWGVTGLGSPGGEGTPFPISHKGASWALGQAGCGSRVSFKWKSWLR